MAYNTLMYIKNRSASALYKLFIGVVALVGFWASLMNFGTSAWRLFSTYVLLVTAAYLLISALIIAMSKKRNPGRIPCPMLDGAIIVSTALLCVATVVCKLQNIIIPGAIGWHASLIYFVLPFLVFSDWALFARKGRWHLIEPFYWLAPAIIYASLILLTADAVSRDSAFRYPVPFLDYSSLGVINMLEWFIAIGVLLLIYGYALVALDFVLSGKLSHYIVLPRLKAVDDEEPEEAEPEEPTIERIEVKLEPLMPPKPRRRNAGSKPKVQDIKSTSTNRKKSQTSQGSGAEAKKQQGQKQGSRQARAARNTDGFKATKPKHTEQPKATDGPVEIKVERKADKKANAGKSAETETVQSASQSSAQANKPKPKIRKF